MNLSKDFLISLPTMATKKFSNSLIYMHEHNGNGAAGWIINKPIDDNEYFVGIPSPAAAGLVLLPLFIFFEFK